METVTGFTERAPLSQAFGHHPKDSRNVCGGAHTACALLKAPSTSTTLSHTLSQASPALNLDPQNQLKCGCFKTQYCVVIVNSKSMEAILLLPIFLFFNSFFLWYVRINTCAVIILLKGLRKDGRLKDSQRPILTCNKQ